MSGITIETQADAGMQPIVTLDRRLWLVEDKSRVVEDGDPEAAFLYSVPGTIVPKAEAEALGAIKKKKEAAQPPPEEPKPQRSKPTPAKE
jgi:hypothetical protein